MSFACLFFSTVIVGGLHFSVSPFSSFRVCFLHVSTSSSSSLYARRRCLLPTRKRLSSSAPPGCHRACPSVVSVLATCPASCSWQCCSHDVCFAGQISDSPMLNLLYMWALSLLCPVLSLNRMTCCGLFSLWRLSDWLRFGCCCFHLFLMRDMFLQDH